MSDSSRSTGRSTPTPPAGRPGYLVAIGGAEDKSQELIILKRVLELAPGETLDVVVIGTASGIPDQVLPTYRDAFTRAGARCVHTLDIRRRSDAGEAEHLEVIRRAEAIFFTGGDQLRLTHVLGGSPLLEAIRERYEAGAVVAGTSAGAVALSTTMIYNGAAVDALRKGGVHMASGLDFVDGLVIDSHFLARGRFTRLMEVGAANPEQLGVGLAEDAAVVIHPNRILEAVGSGHVILVDSRDVMSSNITEQEEGEPVAVENMIFHALIDGHGFDVDARRYLAPAELRMRLQR